MIDIGTAEFFSTIELEGKFILSVRPISGESCFDFSQNTNSEIDSFL